MNQPNTERHPGWGRPEWILTGQVALSAALLVAGVAALAYLFRPTIEAFGRGFVSRFGLLGMAFGSFLADGFSFPLPPQFYFLSAITTGGPQLPAFLAVTAGSLLGGTTGYLWSGQAARIPFVRRRLVALQPRVQALLDRYGYWGIAVGSMTPIPYSVLCYLAGLNRLPGRAFVAVSLFRVPRLVMFYFLIKAGWG